MNWIEKTLLAMVASVVVSRCCHAQDVPKQGTAEQPGRPASAVWNFDMDKAGQPPALWRIAATNAGKNLAVWQVTEDLDAPSKPNVLTIKKTDNKGSTFNVAMAATSTFQDVDLSVKLRPNTGKEDQGGGLIWRCKDENNYYICRINPLEGNYRVYKVVEGKRTQLETTKFKTQAGKWYALRAVMIGDRITCFLDGKKMLEARDETFRNAGMVGLWSKADAASSFDDLSAQEVKGPPKDASGHEQIKPDATERGRSTKGRRSPDHDKDSEP